MQMSSIVRPNHVDFGRVCAFLLLASIINIGALPVTPNNNFHCPVPTTSDELGTNKVLDLNEIKGHKVRLQFFYPREEASKKILDSREISLLVQDASTKNISSTSTGEDDVLGRNLDIFKQDIFCQWTFRAGSGGAGNDSQFLSLTFEKLSAPYSDDCSQAFVAVKKEDGFESRWCGNRRQANARPMSLLAKSTAVITVYRSGKAPLLPPTGFIVAVRVLDSGSLQGSDTNLRILRG